MSDSMPDHSVPPPASLRAGDVDAFDRLFFAYAPSLRRFVYSYVKAWETAEDLVDDVFLQLWLRLNEVKRIREPKTYLFTTARNHALNWLKHQRVEERHREKASVTPPPSTSAPVLPSAVMRQLDEADEDLTDDDLTAAFQLAIGMLSPTQRQVMLLKWQRQATHEEVGSVLGLAPTTISDHYRQAIERLRTILPSILGGFAK
jgi:RNA polymerase sigma-70 factor, ECF subfamily